MTPPPAGHLACRRCSFLRRQSDFWWRVYAASAFASAY
jgi:hypothetical protein